MKWEDVRTNLKKKILFAPNVDFKISYEMGEGVHKHKPSVPFLSANIDFKIVYGVGGCANHNSFSHSVTRVHMEAEIHSLQRDHMLWRKYPHRLPLSCPHTPTPTDYTM